MQQTPTGLDPDDVAKLARYQKQALVAWHREVAGDDNGMAWWPLAIRELSLEYRLVLAGDEAYNAAWQERERRTVVEDAVYFTSGYGSIQPEIGDAIPFDIWPEQQEILEDFITELRVIILKARQLGLTWLALHYALWIQAFAEGTRNAKILGLSKHGGDATKLLARARQINKRLPPFLRQTESTDTARSLSRMKFEGRGEMVSLAGTPDAARSETATLVLVDEFGHIRNQQAQATWTALGPTMGAAGKAIVIFTGNGPSTTPGDGQAAARLFEQANAGEDDSMKAVFLPSSTDPRRTEEWKTRMKATYLDDEDFEIEYAETIEQALQGRTGTKIYSPAGIDQAERLGRELDEQLAAGTIAPPAGELLTIGVDWGENTHMLQIWPLEKGGIYVLPGEIVATNEEPSEVTERLLAAIDELPGWEGAPAPLARYRDLRYDAAGVQSNRTCMKTIRKRAPMFKSKSIAFSKYKRQTVNYLRLLFKRTAGGHEAGIIAISPSNRALLRQLRGLELPTDEAEVDAVNKKGDDHGADALVAGAGPIAASFIGKLEAEREKLQKAA
jgi:hypothetical protein